MGLGTILTLIFGLWITKTRGLEFVDLTQELTEKIPRFPSYGPLETNVSFIGTQKDGFRAQSEEITLVTHLGTHIDAPHHFNSTGWTLKEIPLERLWHVPAAVVDIRHKVFKESVPAGANPDVQLSSNDIIEWESRHGRLPRNSILLINTGWDRFWNDSAMYVGGSSMGNLRYPGMNPEAAKWLVKERPTVYGVGIDALSIDYGESTRFGTHVTLSSANKYILENLTKLNLLPPRGSLINIGAMKLGGITSGAPARVMASLRCVPVKRF